MEALLRTGLKWWRGFAGEDTRLERALRRQYKTVRAHYRAVRGRIEKEIVGENYVLFWSGNREARRVGVYLKGACHLRMVFACKEMIQQAFDGTCCIFNDGEAAGARSDFILQTLSDLPRECVEQITTKLRIPEDYFRPGLFDRTFEVPDLPNYREFPKSVIFFSAGSDLARNMYRHRETGLLVDPGGWWLTQPMEQVLGDLSSVAWFRKNFENIGRIGVETFAGNYEKIIDLVRKRTGARVAVFNVPTVEPGKPVHNYQFVRDPLVRRTRDFNVALAELSRKLDFPIVDIDRILRRAGIGGQKDFAHFAPDLYPLVAREAYEVMRDLGVV